MPRCRLVPLLALLALLLIGCGLGQADIERSIRENMKANLNVTVNTIDLRKLADGSFTGTATAQNGDVYEVSTTPPKSDRIEWKVTPGQTTVEGLVRAGLEQKTSSKVTLLNLTRPAPGTYTGRAELASGEKYNVSTRMEGMQLLWEAKPSSP